MSQHFRRSFEFPQAQQENSQRVSQVQQYASRMQSKQEQFQITSSESTRNAAYPMSSQSPAAHAQLQNTMLSSNHYVNGGSIRKSLVNPTSKSEQQSSSILSQRPVSSSSSLTFLASHRTPQPSNSVTPNIHNSQASINSNISQNNYPNHSGSSNSISHTNQLSPREKRENSNNRIPSANFNNKNKNNFHYSNNSDQNSQNSASHQLNSSNSTNYYSNAFSNRSSNQIGQNTTTNNQVNQNQNPNRQNYGIGYLGNKSSQTAENKDHDHDDITNTIKANNSINNLNPISLSKGIYSAQRVSTSFSQAQSQQQYTLGAAQNHRLQIDTESSSTQLPLSKNIAPFSATNSQTIPHKYPFQSGSMTTKASSSSSQSSSVNVKSNPLLDFQQSLLSLQNLPSSATNNAHTYGNASNNMNSNVHHTFKPQSAQIHSSSSQQLKISQVDQYPIRDDSPQLVQRNQHFQNFNKKSVGQSYSGDNNSQGNGNQNPRLAEEYQRVSKSTSSQDVFQQVKSMQKLQKNEDQEGEKLQQIQSQQAQQKSSVSNQMKSSVNQKRPQHMMEDNSTTVISKLDPLPNHEPTKCSFKRNGIVKAYAANTNQGLVRNYNEDRVSIILNIMKPASRANEQWPKCSFFGVYDGHGGVNCADFLRDNLHQFVIKETAFPWNPKEALRNGFLAAEKAFQELAQASEDHIDRSGSCAITVLIVGDTCYVANVGDSRAVLSGDSGQKVYTLSRDHKPGDELEQKRIINGGGKIYQTHATQVKQGAGDQKAQTQLVVGPLRVFPGRLSVSRTFGDIEAKIEKLGGNPNVVISDPEIKSFKITDDHDFIILASDGVYDKMSSKEVIQSVWSTSAKPEQLQENVHKQCSLGVESILRDSLNKRSLDNVTVVMIAFQNYKEKLFGTSEKLPLEEIKNYQPSALTTKPEENSKYLQLQQTLGSKTATAASSAAYMADKFSDNNEFRLQALTPNNRSSVGEGQIRKKFKENQMFYPQNGVNQQAAPQGNENLCYQPNQGGFTGNNYHNHHNAQFQQNGIGAHLSQQQTMSSQQSSNPQNSHTQFNKLRLLDQKISEISQKTNQFQGFDHKIIGNNR